jgi:hypothetical protein
VKLWKVIYHAVCIAIMLRMSCTQREAKSPCGQEARRLDHGRRAGIPDRGAAACFGQSSPIGARHQAPESDARRALAGRPGSTETAVNAGILQDHLLRDGRSAAVTEDDTGSTYGTGPAEAPLAQANQAPPEIDYPTESVMTTHLTSACTQCKAPLTRSSCGIAQARSVRQAVQASRAYP